MAMLTKAKFGMDLPAYLAYIAGFAKNHSYDVSSEFRDYVEAKLGGFTNISEAKAKSLARHLYRAYVVGLYTRYDAFHLAKTLTDAQLVELLDAQQSLDKKYNVFYPVVDSEIKKLSKVDAVILEQGEPKYKSILVGLSKLKKSKSVAPKPKMTTKPVVPKSPLKTGDYLGYLAFFIQSQATTTKHELRKYFEDNLRAVPLEADDDAVREVARHLYRAYVLGAYTRYRPFHIAENVATSKDMIKYLDAQIALDKSYKIFEDPGMSSAIDDSHTDGGIKVMSLPGYIEILESMDILKSPTTIKAVAAKARAVAKAARGAGKRASSAKGKKKAPVKKVTTKKKALVKKASSPLVVVKKIPAKGKAKTSKVKRISSPLVVVKKVPAKAKPKAKPKPAVTKTDKLMAMKSGKEFMAELAKEKLEKQQRSPAKAKPKPSAVKTVKRTTTTEMTLGELKNIARATGLKGFSTMKKAELKAALKLK